MIVFNSPCLQLIPTSKYSQQDEKDMINVYLNRLEIIIDNRFWHLQYSSIGKHQIKRWVLKGNNGDHKIENYLPNLKQIIHYIDNNPEMKWEPIACLFEVDYYRYSVLSLTSIITITKVKDNGEMKSQYYSLEYKL